MTTISGIVNSMSPSSRCFNALKLFAFQQLDVKYILLWFVVSKSYSYLCMADDVPLAEEVRNGMSLESRRVIEELLYPTLIGMPLYQIFGGYSWFKLFLMHFLWKSTAYLQEVHNMARSPPSEFKDACIRFLKSFCLQNYIVIATAYALECPTRLLGYLIVSIFMTYSGHNDNHFGVFVIRDIIETYYAFKISFESGLRNLQEEQTGVPPVRAEEIQYVECKPNSGLCWSILSPQSYFRMLPYSPLRLRRFAHLLANCYGDYSRLEFNSYIYSMLYCVNNFDLYIFHDTSINDIINSKLALNTEIFAVKAMSVFCKQPITKGIHIINAMWLVATKIDYDGDLTGRSFEPYYNESIIPRSERTLVLGEYNLAKARTIPSAPLYVDHYNTIYLRFHKCTYKPDKTQREYTLRALNYCRLYYPDSNGLRHMLIIKQIKQTQGFVTEYGTFLHAHRMMRTMDSWIKGKFGEVINNGEVVVSVYGSSYKLKRKLPAHDGYMLCEAASSPWRCYRVTGAESNFIWCAKKLHNFVVNLTYTIYCLCYGILFGEAIRVVKDATMNHITELMNPDYKLTPEYQIILVEMLSVINFIYFCMHNQYKVALTHAEYLLATRSNEIRSAFLKIDFSRITTSAPTTYDFEYNGKVYMCSFGQYNQICHAHAEGADLEPLLINISTREGSFVPENKELIDSLSTIASWITTSGVQNMSDEAMRHAVLQMQLKSYEKTGWNNSLNIILQVISVICRVRYSWDPFNKLYQQLAKDVVKIVEFTDEHAADFETINSNPILGQAVIDHRELATKTSMSPQMLSLPPFATKAFNQRRNTLEAAYLKFTAFQRGLNQRKMPLCVFYTGPPETGKTRSEEYQMKAICFRRRIPYGKHLIYEYTTGDGFLEGYVNPMFFLMDDILKVKDPKIRSTELGILISAVNTATWLVPQAFTLKGAISFVSEYVFVTSNIVGVGRRYDNITWDSGMTEDKAVLRRFHVVLHREEKIDETTDIPTLMFRVDKCVHFGNEYEGQWLTNIQIAQMIKRVEDYIDDKYKSGDMTEEHYAMQFPEWAEPQGNPKLDRTGDVPPEKVLASISKMYQESNWTDDVKDVDAIIAEEKRLRDQRNYILGIIVLLSLTTVGVLTYKFMFNDVSSKDEYEAHSPSTKSNSDSYATTFSNSSRASGEMGRRAKRRFARTTSGDRFKPNSADVEVKYVPCAGTDDNYLSTLTNSVLHVLVRFEFSAWDGKDFIRAKTCHGFHYAAGVFVFPAHTIIPFLDQKDVKVKLEWTKGKHICSGLPEYWFVDDEDLCCIRVFCANYPASGKKYLWKYDDVAPLEPGTPMKMIQLLADNQLSMRNLYKAPNCRPARYTEGSETFIVNYPVNYNEWTTPGDSGSPVVIKGQQGRVIIIGFHVCKEKVGVSSGVALPFYQEVIDETSVNCEPQSLDTFPLKIERRVPQNLKYVPQTISKIKKSPLHGFAGKALWEPARMRPFVNELGETINPMYKSLSLYKQESFKSEPIPAVVIETFRNEYPRDPMWNFILNETQVLNGDKEFGIPAIDRKTSPGYPLCLRAKKGKNDFIETVNDVMEFKEEFWDAYRELDRALMADEDVEVLWAECLKDETVKLSKVESGDTRAISAGAFLFQLLGRKYFASFFAYMQHFHNTKSIAVGINPHGMDWTNMEHQAEQEDGSTLCADAIKWDRNVPYDVAMTVCIMLVNWWYNDQYSKLRIKMWKESVNGKTIYEDVIFQTFGVKSGAWNTVWCNSMCRYVVDKTILMMDLKLRNTEFFYKVYGDDNYIKIFGKFGIKVEDIAEHYMRRFGIKIVHWSKSENHDDDNIRTVSFLGRKFAKYRNNAITRCPLDVDVILQSLYWIKGQNDPYQVIPQNVRNAFMELSHHTPQVYYEKSSLILEAIKKHMPDIYDTCSSMRISYADWFSLIYEGESPPYSLYDHSYTTEYMDCEPNSADLGAASVVNPVGENEVFRQVKEPGTTQVDQLGGFADSSETAIGSAAVTDLTVHDTMNMKSFDKDNSLDRMYIIDDLSVPSSAGVGALLATYDFPGILFGKPYISDNIADFLMFKGDIQLTLRSTAQMELSGKLLISIMPLQTFYPINSTTLITQPDFGDYFEASGSPCWTVSLSANSTVSCVHKFTNGRRAMSLRKFGNGEICRFFVYVLAPLRSSDGTAQSATMTVSGQFLNAKLSMPIDITVGPTVRKPVVRQYKNTFIGETKEKEDKEKKSEFDLVRELRREILQLRSKVEELSIDYIACSSVLKEADVKAKNNSISSTLGKVSDISGMLSAVPGIGTYAAATSKLTGYASGMAKKFGLDKPTTVQGGSVMSINPHFNLNQGSGIDTSMKLACDPNNRITTEPVVGGIGVDEMNLSHIIQTPCLVTNSAWLANSTALQVATTGVDSEPCFFDILKLNTMYWKGSHKFLFQFTASSFQVARFVIYVSDEITADYNACQHEFVTVTGDIDFPFSVEYPHPEALTTCVTSELVFNVYVQVLSWSSQSGATTIPIQISVWKAGGPDAMVYCPIDNNFIPSSSETYLECEPNSYEIRSYFKTTEFPALMGGGELYDPKGLVIGEEILTLRDWLHQYVPMSALSADANFQLMRDTNASSIAWQGVDKWSFLFRFWRGSVRFKIIQPQTSSGYPAVMVTTGGSVNAGTPFQGVAFGNTSDGSVSFEVPWYSPALYETVGNSGYFMRTVQYADETANYFRFKAAGDDFSFHWLRLPQPGTWQINTSGSSTGTWGFLNYVG